MRSTTRLRVLRRLTTTGGGITSVTLHVGPRMSTRARTGVAANVGRGGFNVGLDRLKRILSLIYHLRRVGLVNVRYRVNSRVASVTTFHNLMVHIGRVRRRLRTHKVGIRGLGFNNNLNVSCCRPGRLPVPTFSGCFTIFGGLLRLHPKRRIRFRPKHSVITRYNSLVSGMLCMGINRAGGFYVLSTNFARLVHPTVCSTCRHVRGVADSRRIRICSIINPVYRSSSIFNGSIRLGHTRHNSLVTLHSTNTCNRMVTSRCGYQGLPATRCSSAVWALFRRCEVIRTGVFSVRTFT